MSDGPSYKLEHAKSGRAKCRKCKEILVKDEIRIGVETALPGDPEHTTTYYYHPPCFNMPRKLTQQGMDVTAFVEDCLQDTTDEQVLKTIKDQIIEDIASKAKKKKGEDGPQTAMTRIKEHLKQERDEAKGETPAKKIKLSTEDEARLDVYVMYEKKKNDELKDYLAWNRQMRSGVKDMLLARVIDGHMHGRLGYCPVCQRGQLQLVDENADSVICKGYYDEDMSIRIDCGHSGPAADAPRLHPWFTEEPSEEEKAELDRIKEEHNPSSGAKKVAASPKSDQATATLMNQAAALEWNLSDNEGLKKATSDLIDIVVKDGKVDLPQDKARMKVGTLVASNRSMSAPEIMQLVIDQFGFAEQNQEAAASKAASMKKVCKCEENSKLVEVFRELGDLYLKQGNRNAGGIYRKVEAAIRELPFEVTEENVMGLSKGKTKVEGIGKASAEKMLEFLTTGKLEKLEAKRAEVA